MKQLNLEAKNKEQQRIKAYLEENASNILAEKINNGVRIEKDGKILLGRKTLDGFMSFATEEARKQAEKGARYAMVEDAVVFGWAVHYFEEDSIEGTLYNEDGSEYKTQPKPAAKAPTAKAQPKPQPKPQMSMFDLMGEDLEGKPEEDEDAMPSDEEIQEIMAEIAEEEKAKQQKPSTSPVYRKYLDVQDRYPQAIIAMRLGDFYEVFGKNAEVLANELPLTLTGRDCGLESRVPMVGFPYHTAEMYFGKILSNGHTLVVMENDDEVRELPAEQNVDLETGEILSEEEMREFDGDIDESLPTVSGILSDYSTESPSDEMFLKDASPAADEEYAFDVSAFDSEAVAVLSEMFGDEIDLR